MLKTAAAGVVDQRTRVQGQPVVARLTQDRAAAAAAEPDLPVVPAERSSPTPPAAVPRVVLGAIQRAQAEPDPTEAARVIRAQAAAAAEVAPQALLRARPAVLAAFPVVVVAAAAKVERAAVALAAQAVAAK
jgi:hypothetical protein